MGRIRNLNCFCPSWGRKKDKGGNRCVVQPCDDEMSPSFLHIKVDHLHPSFECEVKVINHGNLNDGGGVDCKEEDKPITMNNVKLKGDDGLDVIPSGDISDPDDGKAECLGLKRMSEVDHEQFLSSFYGQRVSMSPVSVRSHVSADKVILKKHSSSKILPSGSRRLWWKLFLWSHRNVHTIETSNPLAVKISALNQLGGGYTSDSAEPKKQKKSRKSFLARKSHESYKDDVENQIWDGFYGACSQQHDQWVAFPSSSLPLERVDEWVRQTAKHREDLDDVHLPTSFGASLDGESARLQEEISHADTVIRSLNANSTVAHISGIGLKVIPSIAYFSSLRSINLSGNFIDHIAPGSLPKGLHVLNLSRNKIYTIEGLRELTHLRVLDLSYNLISSIGQGLSSCTLIKELYLAGNKISNVEGLHRLLKLTVLDLSFNKITTAKALGQLVANYTSVIALNLLGNPIQSNMNDEQLRRTVCSLLPKLALLNRQPLNSQKAREIRVDANAKAVLGNSGSHNSRRKAVRRVENVVGSTSSHKKSRQKIKSRSRRRSSLH